MSNKYTTLADSIRELDKIKYAIVDPILETYKVDYSGMISAVAELGKIGSYLIKPAIQPYIANIVSNINMATIASISNMTKNILYESGIYSSALKELSDTIAALVKIPDIYKTLADSLKSIDWENININEDEETIEVDGEIYNVSSIVNEAKECKEDVATINDVSTSKTFFEKHKIIKFLFFNFLINTIGANLLSNGAYDYVKDVFNENKYAIYSSIFDSEQIGTVIVERAVIRECNNSHSKCVGVVLYGDEVIIIESMRYWYKVSFTNNDGIKQDGYIARKNIDY